MSYKIITKAGDASWYGRVDGKLSGPISLALVTPARADGQPGVLPARDALAVQHPAGYPGRDCHHDRECCQREQDPGADGTAQLGLGHRRRAHVPGTVEPHRLRAPRA